MSEIILMLESAGVDTTDARLETDPDRLVLPSAGFSAYPTVQESVSGRWPFASVVVAIVSGVITITF